MGKEYSQLYYQLNKKRMLERGRRYRETHREYFREYHKEWVKTAKGRESRRISGRKYAKTYIKVHPWVRHMNHIATRTTCKNARYRKKGIKNFLKTKDIEFLWFRDEAFALKHPSIDRINNDGHYTLGNCRFIELEENRRKRDKPI